MTITRQVDLITIFYMLCKPAASQEAHHQCAAPSDAACDEAAACSAEPQIAAADSQLEGLLQIKAVLDADAVMVQWTRQTGRDQGYCRCTGGLPMWQRHHTAYPHLLGNSAAAVQLLQHQIACFMSVLLYPTRLMCAVQNDGTAVSYAAVAVQ
jgi:hypothetical protein